MKDNLIFIGPRSIGKSSVGKVLAKKLKIPFFDFDKIVEKKIGNIDRYIEKNGYDQIRIKEHEILRQFIKKLPKKYILALGGGTIASQLEDVSKKNYQILKKKGKFVCLLPFKSNSRSISLLYEREKIRKGNQDLEQIKKIYSKRLLIYKKIADKIIFVENNKINQIAQKIISLK